MKSYPSFPVLWCRSVIAAWLGLAGGPAFGDSLIASTDEFSFFAQDSTGLWRVGMAHQSDGYPASGISTASSWKALSAGYRYCLAVDTTGALYAWGTSSYGQLGVGSNIYSDGTPLRVGTASDWKSVSAGGALSAGIRTDGSLWTWGAGLPGDWTSTAGSVPTQVGTDKNWKSVATGSHHRIAIRTDGSLWGWGYNSHGPVGDGTNTSRLEPVRIGTANDWASVSCSVYTSFALKTDGSLWGWGGVFGGGTSPTTSNTPVRVGTETGWRTIYLSLAGQAFAIRQDGSLWSWGDNSEGMLGLGDTVSRNSPQRVGTDSDWSSVAPGATHVIARKTDGSIWMWGHLQSSGLPSSQIPVDRTCIFDPSPRVRIFNESHSEIITDEDSITLPTAILGEPTSAGLQVRNEGLTPLTLSVANLPPGFSVDPAPLAVTALTSTTVRIRSSALTKGTHDGTLRLLTNQTNLPVFSMNVTGAVVSPQDDTDGDGINDAAEVAMAALGFNWQSAQPYSVEMFNSALRFAGLLREEDILDVTLNTPAPVIDRSTGKARLKFEFLKTPGDSPLVPAMHDHPSGGLKLDFQVPENFSHIRIRQK